MGRTEQKGELGWMVVFRPDQDAEADGLEDEAFTIIYRKLERAKEECSRYLKTVWGEDPNVKNFEIEWAKDTSSSKAQEIWFGRPRALVDGNFYLYEMQIE
jgi:hypothetical protein